MRDIKERLSLLWIFALLNYLYADVIALWALLGVPTKDAPHLGPMALAGAAVLMEIPIAMILFSRLLPLRANRLANIIAGSIVTLVNGFVTFIPPLIGLGRPPRAAGVPILRNDRNHMHGDDRLAGVDLANRAAADAADRINNGDS